MNMQRWETLNGTREEGGGLRNLESAWLVVHPNEVGSLFPSQQLPHSLSLTIAAEPTF